MTGTKSIPKDLHVMSCILRDFGITEYENGVENHMLDFANRYITGIIEDAVLYSTHANKKFIDVDDVRLAIELQQDHMLACPPPRELTAYMSRNRNNLPLPSIRSSAGLRLPPDRYSLISSNYHLKSVTKKPRTVHTISRVAVSNLTSNLASSISTTPSSISPRPSYNIPKTVQTPLIKFSEANKSVAPSTASSPMTNTSTVSSVNTSVTSQILMPTAGLLNETKISNDLNINNKRPHEEDDNYDN